MMDKTLKLNVRLFGAFRKYHNGTLSLEIAEGVNVARVKALIAQRIHDLAPEFQDRELIEKSALANNRRVLNPTDCFTESENLAILPPVCGG